jgi:hypothetical protein
VFSACKKDETGSNKKSIIGKWKLLNYTSKGGNKDIFRSGSYLLISETSLTTYAAVGNDPFETNTVTYVREGQKLKTSDDVILEITKSTANQLTLDDYEVESNGKLTYYGTIELSK